MTLQTASFHPAPAAPAPAPSQIRFPKNPEKSRRSPVGSPARSVETLYATSLRVLSPAPALQGQEYPTRLH
ncbi:hypothetical protein [Phaeobacter sp. CECT 5382]|uniref:hypothetical protein n=1 Tax=Phaeobacter sp. CECT 5382 TaxID=1712645 RepID=UPI0012E366BB|nr:hypothetical protein [Phaeobacter sp. CECT 5382]